MRGSMNLRIVLVHLPLIGLFKLSSLSSTDLLFTFSSTDLLVLDGPEAAATMACKEVITGEGSSDHG